MHPYIEWFPWVGLSSIFSRCHLSADVTQRYFCRVSRNLCQIKCTDSDIYDAIQC